MKNILITSSFSLLCIGPVTAGEDQPLNETEAVSAESQVNDLLGRMILEEKISYSGGVRGFWTGDIPRSGIPAFKTNDGPSGVKGGGTTFPGDLVLAASFDSELARQVDESLGRDCRATGINISLTLGMNMVRSPIGGRAIEYFGEDPFLSSKMVVQNIKGLQS
jgi:beta-glucosidase